MQTNETVEALRRISAAVSSGYRQQAHLMDTSRAQGGNEHRDPRGDNATKIQPTEHAGALQQMPPPASVGKQRESTLPCTPEPDIRAQKINAVTCAITREIRKRRQVARKRRCSSTTTAKKARRVTQPVTIETIAPADIQLPLYYSTVQDVDRDHVIDLTPTLSTEQTEDTAGILKHAVVWPKYNVNDTLDPSMLRVSRAPNTQVSDIVERCRRYKWLYVSNAVVNALSSNVTNDVLAMPCGFWISGQLFNKNPMNFAVMKMDTDVDLQQLRRSDTEYLANYCQLFCDGLLGKETEISPAVASGTVALFRPWWSGYALVAEQLSTHTTGSSASGFHIEAASVPVYPESVTADNVFSHCRARSLDSHVAALMGGVDGMRGKWGKCFLSGLSAREVWRHYGVAGVRDTSVAMERLIQPHFYRLKVVQEMWKDRPDEWEKARNVLCDSTSVPICVPRDVAKSDAASVVPLFSLCAPPRYGSKAPPPPPPFMCSRIVPLSFSQNIKQKIHSETRRVRCMAVNGLSLHHSRFMYCTHGAVPKPEKGGGIYATLWLEASPVEKYDNYLLVVDTLKQRYGTKAVNAALEAFSKVQCDSDSELLRTDPDATEVENRTIESSQWIHEQNPRMDPSYKRCVAVQDLTLLQRRTFCARFWIRPVTAAVQIRFLDDWEAACNVAAVCKKNITESVRYSMLRQCMSLDSPLHHTSSDVYITPEPLCVSVRDFSRAVSTWSTYYNWNSVEFWNQNSLLRLKPRDSDIVCLRGIAEHCVRGLVFEARRITWFYVFQCLMKYAQEGLDSNRNHTPETFVCSYESLVHVIRGSPTWLREQLWTHGLVASMMDTKGKHYDETVHKRLLRVQDAVGSLSEDVGGCRGFMDRALDICKQALGSSIQYIWPSVIVDTPWESVTVCDVVVERFAQQALNDAWSTLNRSCQFLDQGNGTLSTNAFCASSRQERGSGQQDVSKRATKYMDIAIQKACQLYPELADCCKADQMIVAAGILGGSGIADEGFNVSLFSELDTVYYQVQKRNRVSDLRPSTRLFDEAPFVLTASNAAHWVANSPLERFQLVYVVTVHYFPLLPRIRGLQDSVQSLQMSHGEFNTFVNKGLTRFMLDVSARDGCCIVTGSSQSHKFRAVRVEKFKGVDAARAGLPNVSRNRIDLPPEASATAKFIFERGHMQGGVTRLVESLICLVKLKERGFKKHGASTSFRLLRGPGVTNVSIAKGTGIHPLTFVDKVMAASGFTSTMERENVPAVMANLYDAWTIHQCDMSSTGTSRAEEHKTAALALVGAAQFKASFCRCLASYLRIHARIADVLLPQLRAYVNGERSVPICGTLWQEYQLFMSLEHIVANELDSEYYRVSPFSVYMKDMSALLNSLNQKLGLVHGDVGNVYWPFDLKFCLETLIGSNIDDDAPDRWSGIQSRLKFTDDQMALMMTHTRKVEAEERMFYAWRFYVRALLNLDIPASVHCTNTLVLVCEAYTINEHIKRYVTDIASSYDPYPNISSTLMKVVPELDRRYDPTECRNRLNTDIQEVAAQLVARFEIPRVSMLRDDAKDWWLRRLEESLPGRYTARILHFTDQTFLTYENVVMEMSFDTAHVTTDADVPHEQYQTFQDRIRRIKHCVIGRCATPRVRETPGCRSVLLNYMHPFLEQDDIQRLPVVMQDCLSPYDDVYGSLRLCVGHMMTWAQHIWECMGRVVRARIDPCATIIDWKEKMRMLKAMLSHLDVHVQRILRDLDSFVSVDYERMTNREAHHLVLRTLDYLRKQSVGMYSEIRNWLDDGGNKSCFLSVPRQHFVGHIKEYIEDLAPMLHTCVSGQLFRTDTNAFWRRCPLECHPRLQEVPRVKNSVFDGYVIALHAMYHAGIYGNLGGDHVCALTEEDDLLVDEVRDKLPESVATRIPHKAQGREVMNQACRFSLNWMAKAAAVYVNVQGQITRPDEMVKSVKQTGTYVSLVWSTAYTPCGQPTGYAIGTRISSLKASGACITHINLANYDSLTRANDAKRHKKSYEDRIVSCTIPSEETFKCLAQAFEVSSVSQLCSVISRVKSSNMRLNPRERRALEKISPAELLRSRLQSARSRAGTSRLRNVSASAKSNFTNVSALLSSDLSDASDMAGNDAGVSSTFDGTLREDNAVISSIQDIAKQIILIHHDDLGSESQVLGTTAKVAKPQEPMFGRVRGTKTTSNTTVCSESETDDESVCDEDIECDGPTF